MAEKCTETGRNKLSGDAKSFFAVDLIFFVVFFVCFHVLRKDDLSLVGGG